MASRGAQWAFAAAYGTIALIALWGGFVQLNPPAPAPNPFNPDPLPLLVNSAMFTAAMFYFLTAAAFVLATAYAVRGVLSNGENGLVNGLNVAFSAFLGVVGVYLLWYGAQLLMLGGSFAYALSGVALLAAVFFLIRHNPLGALIYAGIVTFWVVMSIVEAGLDFMALLPRLAAWIVVGLWFLSPWHRVAMGKTTGLTSDAGGRWAGIAVAAAAALLVVGAVQGYRVEEGTDNGPVTDTATTDWRHYGGGPGGQRFAQIDQINVENVHELEKAWEFRTGVNYDFKQTPQMANGMVYLCTAGNNLIAVDADNGNEIWRHDTNTKVSSPSSYPRTCRGVGYHEAPATYAGECPKRIITSTTDARLVAVDAMTGRRCTTFGFDGEVNILSGLGYAPPGNYMVTSTPLVAGDNVVFGGWVTDNQQIGNPSGVLRAYDAMTGEFTWAWDMGNPSYQGLPDEGGEFTRGTPNVWSHTSYDPELNLIYAPTGNASPDYFNGDLRTDEMNENASSIVAIDAETGVRRWVYQTVHRDIWDYDVPSQPVLVDVRKDGQGEPIPAVAQPTKRGDIFLLDRRTGIPIYDTPEVPVPQNPEPGEFVSATQPVSPLPDFRADRAEKDMWGLTPLDMLFCRIEFKKMRYEGHFTPPMRGGGGYGQAEDTWGGSFQYPGTAGGFNWGSVSVDADNGLLIGAPMLLGNRITLTNPEDRAAQRAQTMERRAERDDHAGPPAPPAGAGGRQQSPEAAAHAQRFDQDRVIYRASTGPFMSDWRLPLPFIHGADNQLISTNLPCFEPPFSQIGAMDLNTRQLLWKRPIGSMKQSGPFGIQSGLGFMVGTPLTGGTMTTRGGLAFHGGTMDATLRAFDIRTGKVKWQTDLPESAQATPMSYVGKNGKQYVLITVPTPSWSYAIAGVQRTGPPDPEGGYVIAYALPETAE